ncbi:DcaP family trimeric outer membrane transporter [Marinobacter fonticola]|uniref:DcaP family trimeric outer membrane transporter n=1 Tax=Marinobacter fonticola TaxID=2603215 RepID=UPI0011E6D472|nr:DcaP family trimeric outer membrane transporter [Marinobacter fonticola]
MNRNTITIAVRAATSVLALGFAGSTMALGIAGKTSDGMEYSAEIYGYARLNASYDVDEDISNSTRSGDFSKVNTGDDEDNEISGHFGADAVQSRLGVKAMLPHDVKVVVEGDFRPGSLRLRHAYGEYMGWMAGQNWSNYTSFVGFTPTLDFDALPGNAGVQFRAAQLRYTNGPLSISAEEPLSYSGLIDGAGGDAEKEGLPVLTARLENKSGVFSYSTAAILRQVSYDTGTNDDDAIGYGAFAAVTLSATDSLKLYGVINYTNGANTYLYRSGENFAAEDGYVDGSGNLELISGYGGTVGLTIDLGSDRSINAGVGMTEVDWDDAEQDLGSAVIGDKHETNTSAMINYQWHLQKNVTMGIEYAYYMVDEVDGDDGDASRLLFAAQYNF